MLLWITLFSTIILDTNCVLTLAWPWHLTLSDLDLKVFLFLHTLDFGLED